MHLIIILLVISIIAWKLGCKHAKLPTIPAPAGIRIEECPAGKYCVLGRIVIRNDDLRVPSSLRKHYTLVFPFGAESRMFLLTSHEPPVESEGMITIN